MKEDIQSILNDYIIHADGCPKCDKESKKGLSLEIQADDIDFQDNRIYRHFSCNTCDFSWNEDYVLEKVWHMNDREEYFEAKRIDVDPIGLPK